ncbi:ATP-binding cassette sub-family A member 17-like [Epargyreus clarus]|uniref:ATP-binding cassette sub-family A member 17-like n=1 Tax=Epargyreus clarus TaxID=520877 RepID=UPI003C2AC23A
MFTEETKKSTRNRFYQHVNSLIWKSYLQRQRRWRLLLVETLFAGVLFLVAVFVAKPVFLTPLQVEPRPPLSSRAILATLQNKNVLGYAPSIPPYTTIMLRVSDLLGLEILSAQTQDDLNDLLYNRSRGTSMKNPVIWVIWGPTDNNIWRFSIRSTERARYATCLDHTSNQNSHLRSGFLAVQLAVSKAILEHVSESQPDYEISLRSMPVSPLMQESRVRRAISNILMCFTMALLPPVLETEALVVTETVSRFKRALRIRDVSFPSMYVAWVVYACLTALPACVLGSITLILVFRWIHLFYTLILVFAYTSLMIMLALIMAMFHNRALIACIWTTLFTFLQTFLAELLVHHRVDDTHPVLTFILHIIIPPLGLVHGFNEFALLQTGKLANIRGEGHSTIFILFSWIVMILFYFGVLMVMQRTLKERSIGGQVSWKSIIFKEVEDLNRLRRLDTPTGREREQLQEVDELVAKAISFRNVTKTIMGDTVLNNVTFDIYRGEFTMLYAEQVQQRMIITVEDLLTGLTYPDKGTVNILGENMAAGKNLMTRPHMTGYCHRSNFLVEDLTVEEHINLFLGICLWQESDQYITEYGHVRLTRLLTDCDLEGVRQEYVRNVDQYYRAQLCWALGILLEPKVILIPSFQDKPTYVSVIKDKIMQHKQYLTIVKLCLSSIKLEFADRVFLFDSKVLVFGGTPAYMFFKYGREYRVRITFRYGSPTDVEAIAELLDRAAKANATIRAHLGSLLILRLPASPTSVAAALIKDLTDNSDKYGIVSMNISLPDSEEVCNRAIHQSRVIGHEMSTSHDLSRQALRRIADSAPWRRNVSLFGNIHMKSIAWKYITFYIYYRFYLIVTVISAILAGIFIGLSLSKLLSDMEKDQATKILLHGQVMTVEALEQKTNLVLRLENSRDAISVANAYVLSETGATEKEIENMGYTALSKNESITEYLATRAIDSPQHYVYMFAYGMDVFTDDNGTLNVLALYSPMHHDDGAAARSIARAHMALIRHYTSMDATIEVTDDPLALDLTPWLRDAATPPLMIQVLLILTISHITLLPSKEYGLIRHTQSNAFDFSPVSYWITLYICDLVLYWMLVVIMTAVMILLMFLIAPTHFNYMDLVIIPFMLTFYGIGCIPQAYLFSLSKWSALNSMTFVIVNILFGETTVVAKLLYGNALNYVLHFMSLSPQFNMAYAFVKIKEIFFYNSECVVFKRKNLCTSKTLHKCCDKCGVLQQCFTRKSFWSRDTGVMMEINAILTTALVYTTLLLLWEYKVFQRTLKYIASHWIYTEKQSMEDDALGVKHEKEDVQNKVMELRTKQRTPGKLDTFGNYILAKNVSYKHMGRYVLQNVNFGLSEGEALALSGLRHQGRYHLCQILAGHLLPSEGQLWAMSKWKLQMQPYMYSRNVSLSCELDSLPHWMTVYDALEMIGRLRGVPREHMKTELMKYIDALELHDLSDTYIIRLRTTERKRVNFAAAIIGAPPVIVLDEATAYQKYSVRRAMYYILYHLRRRGHAIFTSSGSVESHMPVTNRLAILVDGHIYDIDQIDNLVERYSTKGYTVVVHLKYEVDVTRIFAKYFKSFTINDSTEVLVNIQVLDSDLNWATIFEKMEKLQADHHVVYSYVVSAIPIDYIYNTIIINETGKKVAVKPKSWCLKCLLPHKPKVRPSKEKLKALMPFEKKYYITKLKELPWSVIFNR